MVNEISFPKLGLELKLPENLISFGNFSIKWYGFLIVLGMVLAVIFAFRNCKKFGLDMEVLYEPVFYAVMAGIIGARLYYCIFNFDAYKDNPISILYIWEGGLAIYGGIIGAGVVGVLMCKSRKVPVLPVLDMASMGFLIGQGVGRWGNFFNAEAFGCNTNLPWGMTGPSIVSQLYSSGVTGDVVPTDPVHPTFLYESLWCLLGFLLLRVFVLKRRRFDGQIALMYVMWYGFERMFVEGIRTDSLMVGNIRVSQLLSFVLFIAATVTLIVIALKIRRQHDKDYMPLFVNTDGAEELFARAEKIREDDRIETEKRKEKRRLKKEQSKVEAEDETN